MRLVDIAPTLCRLLGFEIPAQFVGRSLDELLDPAALAALPSGRRLRGRTAAPTEAPPAAGPMTPKQRAQVERGLRDLGYL